MRIPRIAVGAGVTAFSVHLLLVVFVLVICQLDPDPSVVIWWSVFSYVDFPSSQIVEMLHPSYNVPVATAFIILGGLQWALIAALLVACLRKLLIKKTSHRR